jgi:ubiquinone/menaquinone biosynthesis C-methylase UbiE
MNGILEATNIDKFIALTPLMRLGNNRKRRDEMMVYFRHIVLKMLHDEGILSTFEKPISIEDAAKKSGWEYPSDYVDMFVSILANDKVLKRSAGVMGNEYSLSSGFKLAEKDPVVHHFEDFDVTYAEYVKNIPARLKGVSQEFTGTISLFNWDSALASQLYQAVRDSAFAFIDKKWLRNAKLLDAGCGPGYETADMWVKLAGMNAEITAIEPDEGLIKIAEADFTRNVKKAGLDIDPNAKDVKLPTFHQGTVEKLEFDDNTFDAVYFSNILHWTPDPPSAIKEIVRVIKPGGMLFGAQSGTETTNPYMNLVTRTIKNTYGFFSRQDFTKWMIAAGIKFFKTATIVNTFKGFKRG